MLDDELHIGFLILIDRQLDTHFPQPLWLKLDLGFMPLLPHHQGHTRRQLRGSLLR